MQFSFITYLICFSPSDFFSFLFLTLQLEACLKKYYCDVIKVQSVVRAFFAKKLVKRLIARARMDAQQRAADAARQADDLRRKYDPAWSLAFFLKNTSDTRSDSQTLSRQAEFCFLFIFLFTLASSCLFIFQSVCHFLLFFSSAFFSLSF